MAIHKHHVEVLKKLKTCRALTQRKAILNKGGKQLQRVLREIAHNVLRGNVSLTKKQLKDLKKHRRGVRLIAGKKPTVKRRLKVQQRGGFLSALIAPILTTLASSILR